MVLLGDQSIERYVMPSLRTQVRIGVGATVAWICVQLVGRFLPSRFWRLSPGTSDPELYLEVAVLALLAVGLQRGSRACGFFAFLFVSASAIATAIPAGNLLFLWISVGFAALTFVGFRAASRLHSYRVSHQQQSGTRTFVAALGAAAGVSTLFAIVGLVSVALYAPPLKVLAGAQVPKRILSTINDLSILEPGELIRFFYSDGILNVRWGMYLLTDRRLILFSSQWVEPQISIPFSEIADLAAYYSDSWFLDTEVSVVRTNGDVGA